METTASGHCDTKTNKRHEPKNRRVKKTLYSAAFVRFLVDCGGDDGVKGAGVEGRRQRVGGEETKARFRLLGEAAG